jgi:hypothetical protein
MSAISLPSCFARSAEHCADGGPGLALSTCDRHELGDLGLCCGTLEYGLPQFPKRPRISNVLASRLELVELG